jgi:hypothetical protein
VLGPRGHHPVGLTDALERQIVDHHPDIACPAIEADVFKIKRIRRGVESARKPLRRRFFVPCRAVDLSGQEESGDVAHF